MVCNIQILSTESDDYVHNTVESCTVMGTAGIPREIHDNGNTAVLALAGTPR